MELCRNSFMWMVDYFVKYISYDLPWKKIAHTFFCHNIAQIFFFIHFDLLYSLSFFLFFFLYKLTKKWIFEEENANESLFLPTFSSRPLFPILRVSPVSNIFRYVQAPFRELIRVNKIKIPTEKLCSLFSLTFLFRVFFSCSSDKNVFCLFSGYIKLTIPKRRHITKFFLLFLLFLMLFSLSSLL